MMLLLMVDQDQHIGTNGMYKIECIKCNLHENGIHQPYIGNKAKYLIIGESPASAHYSLTPNESKF
jgi:hypothetical protein